MNFEAARSDEFGSHVVTALLNRPQLRLTSPSPTASGPCRCACHRHTDHNRDELISFGQDRISFQNVFKQNVGIVSMD